MTLQTRGARGFRGRKRLFRQTHVARPSNELRVRGLVEAGEKEKEDDIFPLWEVKLIYIEWDIYRYRWCDNVPLFFASGCALNCGAVLTHPTVPAFLMHEPAPHTWLKFFLSLFFFFLASFSAASFAAFNAAAVGFAEDCPDFFFPYREKNTTNTHTRVRTIES